MKKGRIAFRFGKLGDTKFGIIVPDEGSDSVVFTEKSLTEVAFVDTRVNDSVQFEIAAGVSFGQLRMASPVKLVGPFGTVDPNNLTPGFGFIIPDSDKQSRIPFSIHDVNVDPTQFKSLKGKRVRYKEETKDGAKVAKQVRLI